MDNRISSKQIEFDSFTRPKVIEISISDVSKSAKPQGLLSKVGTILTNLWKGIFKQSPAILSKEEQIVSIPIPSTIDNFEIGLPIVDKYKFNDEFNRNLNESTFSSTKHKLAKKYSDEEYFENEGFFYMDDNSMMSLECDSLCKKQNQSSIMNDDKFYLSETNESEGEVVNHDKRENTNALLFKLETPQAIINNTQSRIIKGTQDRKSVV